eukprot:29049-Pelagococcus_subviridis.AAC.1
MSSGRDASAAASRKDSNRASTGSGGGAASPMAPAARSDGAATMNGQRRFRRASASVASGRVPGADSCVPASRRRLRRSRARLAARDDARCTPRP